MSRCRSCGASIQWAITDEKRNMIPLDPEPVEHGNVVVKDPHFATHRGTAWLVHVLNDVEVIGPRIDGEPLYVKHFFTCPNADRHRRS